MSSTALLKRYARLYLPALILGGLCIHIGMEGLIPAMDGEIPRIRGAERIIYLADSPVAFWYEVSQRVFMVLMGPVFGFGLAWARRSDQTSDRLIFQRSRRDQALDRAVRRPLKPD